MRSYVAAALILGPTFGAFFAIEGAWWSFMAPAAFVVLSLVARWLTSKRPRHAVALLLLGLWLGPLWAVLTTGGLRSPLLVWLAPTPFMAGALLGRRAATLLGVASIGAIVGVGILVPQGFLYEMSSPSEARLLTGLSVGGAVALLTFYGWATTKKYDEARASLEKQTEDMQTVLNSVDQGLCLIARDGRVLGGTSAALTRWFGPPKEGVLLWSYARPHHAVAAEMLELAWGALEDGVMPGWVVLEQCAKQVEIAGRTYTMNFRPVGDPDTPSQVLLVMTDVTETQAAEQAAQRTREMLAVFEQHVKDPATCTRSLNEMGTLVERVVRPPLDDEQVTRARAMHTLKGTAALCGLASLAKLAHLLEDAAEDGGDDANLREALNGHWRDLSTRIAAWSGSSETAQVDLRELEHVAAQARRLSPQLHEAVARLGWAHVDRRLRQIGEQGASLAERLGKPRPHVVVEADDVRLPRGLFEDFWTNLVHVVRNAVDHGLEDPPARTAKGKPEAGTLTLRAKVEGHWLTVGIQDDGAGIDWEKVAARSRSLGLHVEGEAGLVDALFSDGVSTAGAVTEVSGRGVGLAAVRQAVVEAGGRLAVTSHQGALFRFELPIPSVLAPAHAISAPTAA